MSDDSDVTDVTPSPRSGRGSGRRTSQRPLGRQSREAIRAHQPAHAVSRSSYSPHGENTPRSQPTSTPRRAVGDEGPWNIGRGRNSVPTPSQAPTVTGFDSASPISRFDVGTNGPNNAPIPSPAEHTDPSLVDPDARTEPQRNTGAGTGTLVYLDPPNGQHSGMHALNNAFQRPEFNIGRMRIAATDVSIRFMEAHRR